MCSFKMSFFNLNGARDARDIKRTTETLKTKCFDAASLQRLIVLLIMWWKEWEYNVIFSS